MIVNGSGSNDLLHLAERVRDAGESVIDTASVQAETDHEGFMYLAFAVVHLEHLASVLTLVEAELHRDAAVIARTMIEGMCLLRWVAEDPGDRALGWRQFAWVEDFRTLHRVLDKNEAVEQEDRKRIESNLRKHGDRFLTRKARNRLNEDPSQHLGPEDYQTNWLKAWGTDITAIAKNQLPDDGDKAAFRAMYQRTSKWAHWTIRGVVDAVSIDLESQTVQHHAPMEATRDLALAAAIAATLETLGRTRHHFQLADSLKSELTECLNELARQSGEKPANVEP